MVSSRYAGVQQQEHNDCGVRTAFPPAVILYVVQIVSNTLLAAMQGNQDMMLLSFHFGTYLMLCVAFRVTRIA